MDERLDARFPAEFEAIVTDLERRDSTISGRVVDISGSGICLALPTELASRRIVKLEIAGSSLFGHVVYSKAHGTQFRTGIEITRVLMGDSGLSKLLKSVLEEHMPAVSGVN